MDGWANRHFPLWQQWPLSSSIEVKCEDSSSALLPTHQDVIHLHVDCNFLNVTDELVHHSNPKWKPHLEKDSSMSAHGMSLLTLDPALSDCMHQPKNRYLPMSLHIKSRQVFPEVCTLFLLVHTCTLVASSVSAVTEIAFAI